VPSIILSGTAWAVKKVFDFSGLRSGKKIRVEEALAWFSHGAGRSLEQALVSFDAASRI